MALGTQSPEAGLLRSGSQVWAMAGNPGGRHLESAKLKIGSELGGRLGRGPVWGTGQLALALGWVRQLSVLWQGECSDYCGQRKLVLRAPGLCKGPCLPPLPPRVTVFMQSPVILHTGQMEGEARQATPGMLAPVWAGRHCGLPFFLVIGCDPTHRPEL